MPSFKELMQSFLYEDVADDDEDEDDYIEPITTPDEHRNGSPSVNLSPTPTEHNTAPAYTPPVSTSVNNPVPSDLSISGLSNNMVASEAVLQNKSSIFTGLNMEDISKPEPEKETEPESRPNSAYRYDRRKIAKPVRRQTNEFEYEAVISPIFGNMDDDDKEFEAVHDAVNLPRPTEEIEMTSVISPMFGSGKTAGIEQAPVEHIPAYQPKQKVNKKKKAAPTRDEKKSASYAQPSTNAKPIRDVADLLTREPISAPAEKKTAEQSEQLSLESNKA